MLTKPFIPYNYLGECASIMIAALVLLVIFYSKPRRTYIFKYAYAGLWWSILTCVIQISILVVANKPDQYYNRYVFLGQLIAFLISYNATLYHVFSYVNMMSIQRRSQRKEFMLIYMVLTLVYVIGVIVELASGNIYTMMVGGIDITHFTRFYCCAGIVCAVICFGASVTNKSDISRIVWNTVCMLVPIEIILLAGEAITVRQSHVIFTGLSYTLVFTLAFLLFHTETFDEVAGSQGLSALDQYIERNYKKKQFYLLNIYFSFPSTSSMEDAMVMGMRGIAACRSIEGISKKITLFKINEGRFIDVIDNCDEAEARNIINQVRGVFDSVKADISLPFNYVMITGKVTDEFESPFLVRQFYEFVGAKFTDQNSSHFYTINNDDIEEFKNYYELSNTLKDIRNAQDFDDERIVVYAQPIYSVQSGGFRVAEALMRLKIGDKLILPDVFIPIAEVTGCIHVLSCIILNKVCKEIESLSEFYDFDAISINISSKELSDNKMYMDLLDIIEKYDIDVSKIRMEITETAMFENYELATRNMENLTKEGIQLYLDDFGTGYSSLERVMNCPIKTIKFDKALLYKSLDDNRMDDILSYMIDVFKKNGFVTLIEGVEDDSQSRYSVERGFDYIQGYHYAKPGPIEDLKNYFTKKTTT